MEDLARRTAGILLPVVLSFLALGCGTTVPSAPTENRTPAPVPIPAPAPGPAPVSTRYDLSGMVVDDNGSPIANAEVAVEYLSGNKQSTTFTNASGRYSMVVDTATRELLIHAGGGEYEHYYVQALPSEATSSVRNLRLRRIRTFDAGQSLVISIDPDSSLAYDGEDWWQFGMVWERLHVRVAEAGTLTIDARPAGAETIPTWLAVFCVRTADNCRFDWVKAPLASGSGSLSVKANSLFEFRVAIPSQAAPQRFEIATSLQR